MRREQLWEQETAGLLLPWKGYSRSRFQDVRVMVEVVVELSTLVLKVIVEEGRERG